MPGLGGTASSTASPTNTLKSFGGLLPAIPGQGALNIGAGILGIATAANPVGAIAFGIGTITGIFTKHHQEALAKEGSTLNAADPAVRDSFNAIVNALNAGQIDRQTAAGLVDQTVAQYDQTVAGITNNPGATADSNKCNAACFVRVHYILPWANALKQIIASNGTANFGPIPSHATQSGLAAFSLTVNSNAGTPGQAGQNTPPISTGLANNGQTPTALGPLGTNVGGGTIVPFSSQSGATPPAQGAPAPGAAPMQETSTILGLSTTNFVIIAAVLAVAVVTVAGIAGERRRG